MIYLRRLLILALAVALHAAALGWALDRPHNIDLGSALGDGEMGVEIGLGTQGSYEDSIKRLSDHPEQDQQQEELPKPPVATTAVPKPQTKTDKKTESNMPVKKPQTLPKPQVAAQPRPAAPEIPLEQQPLPAQSSFQVATAETAAASENTVSANSSPENSNKETPVQASTSNTTTDEKTKPAAASEARVKGTGKADQKSAGGKKGSARNYISQLMSWLNRFQEYPTAARKNKQEGIVKLQFSINRQGEVLSARIYESSGYPELDQAALAMMAAASPLPAVPDDFYPGRNQLPLVIPVEYSLITNTSFKD
jgi:periplasmic protein TonB